MDRDLVKRPFFMEKKHFLVEMKAAMTELISQGTEPIAADFMKRQGGFVEYYNVDKSQGAEASLWICMKR